MRYRATQKTFFDGRLYEKGEEIEAKKTPSRWFELVKKVKPQEPAADEKPAPEKPAEVNTPAEPPNEEPEGANETPEPTNDGGGATQDNE